MRHFRKKLAVFTAIALLLTMVLPSASSAQQLPIPAAGQGYDEAKQADSMIQRHDKVPKLDGKLTKKMKSASDSELIPLIIHLKDKADLKNLRGSSTDPEKHKSDVINKLKDHAQSTQSSVISLLEKQKERGKAREIKGFWLFNGITVKADKETVYQLAQNPMVETITYNDIRFKALGSPSAGPVPSQNEPPADPPPVLPETWGITKIGASQVWNMGYNGAGVVVGHLDTGVDPRHPDLLIDPNGDPEDINNWKLTGWAEFDFSGALISSDRQTAYDDAGHGTHTAGTVMGNAYSGTAIGVAPGARLISAKVLDQGSGTFEQVVAGMQWIATVPGVRVVNMSLGAFGAYPEMIEPTRNIVGMGIYPSFSIGNEGPNSSGSPGNVPAACGVGATDESDQIAFFSGGERVKWDAAPYHGEYLKPDVSAPGVFVYSSLPGGIYEYYDGTSMAAPHVTGAVALILQARPWLNVDEVKSLLKQTAADLGDAGPDTRFGWGRIDVKAAVDLLQNTGFVSGYITGPNGEAVEADISVDGKLLGKADPVYGAFDLLLPAGSHELKLTHPLYRDSIAIVNITPEQVSEQNFRLEKKALGSFTGTVKNSAHKPVPNTTVELEGVKGAVAKTDSQGIYRIDNIPEGTYKVRVIPPVTYGMVRSEAVIPAAGGQVTKDFTLIPANVLLIDHDYLNNWELYYFDALIQKGYSPAYWDWDAAYNMAPWSANPLPPADVLKQFNKVILADTDGFAIYMDDAGMGTRVLRQYLDTGRKMLVSGQDIGLTSGSNFPEFYTKYLHASFQGETGVTNLQGVSSDNWPAGVLAGLNLNITPGGDGANNQFGPDVTAPADNQAASIADYAEFGGSGALAVDGPLHRLAYFSFGFEGINGAETRGEVMDRILKYFDMPTENTSAVIDYSTDWQVAADVYATDGRYRVSGNANAAAAYDFTGDNITWITAKGPACGKAEVLLDGISQGTIDLYNPTWLWQQEFSYSGLSYGKHTLTIKALGQKNPSSTGSNVVIDALTMKTDDRDPAGAYTGNWVKADEAGAHNNTITSSGETDAAYSIYFEGQSVTWFASKGPDRGIARLYLDGTNKGTIDLYDPQLTFNQPVKTFSGLPVGKHTLKIVVTGAQNPVAGGNQVVNDALAMSVEENSSQIAYSSNWTGTKEPAASGGNLHYSDAPNSKAAYSFGGTSITLYTAKGTNMGTVRVYIDGADKGTVNLYSSKPAYKVPLTYSGLTTGLHTIEIVNTGTKSKASTGYRIVIDAFSRGLNG